MKRAHSLLGEALHIIQSHQCIAKRMLSLDERTRILRDLMDLGPRPGNALMARKLALLLNTDSRTVARESVIRYGAFRVAYRLALERVKDGFECPVFTVATEDDCLDEAAITLLAEQVALDVPRDADVWIEHQDPATGDWRKW